MPTMKWMTALILAGALALAMAACSDPVPPAAPTPVTPTTTETFPGTLVVGGVNTLPFTVSQVGGLEVTLSSVDPLATIGIGVGTLGNGTCSLSKTVTTGPGSTAQLTGTATIAGDFCLQVFDTGTLTGSVAFTVSVLHS